MRILLTNDDGIHSAGLLAMYKHLSKLGRVWVVAPSEERSTTGHSLTLHKPLRLITLDKDWYSVSGSPADCASFGIREVMPQKPHLVVSGINRGANLGQDVFYSGTVSAAREASIMGFDSIAVSLAFDHKRGVKEKDLHYDSAARVALKLIETMAVKRQIEWPKMTVLNLNVPNLSFDKVKGLKVARQGFRKYGGPIVKRRDHRGRDYYWGGGAYRGFVDASGTDCYWIHRGYSTVTPLNLDTTDYRFLENQQDLLEHSTLPKRGKPKR